MRNNELGSRDISCRGAFAYLCANNANCGRRTPPALRLLIRHPGCENMETIVACDTCGRVQRGEQIEPGTILECCRCGSTIVKHNINSLSRTAAFSLGA